MTREEAINELEWDKHIETSEKKKEAYVMAIKALEQEPCTEVLDKIRAEFISLYPKNYAGELELGGFACVFSLHQVLRIIDKYKAERSE